jgi:hypothetical protein
MGVIYFSKELFNLEHPSVIQASIYDQDSGRFNLTGDTFRFYIGVQDVNYNFLDTSIFTISASFPVLTWSLDANNQPVFNYSNITPLRVEQCDLNIHFKNFKDQVRGQQLNNLLCINPDDAEKTYLKGWFGEVEFAYLWIQLSSCKNGTTKGITCKSQEEIDSTLNGGYIAANFIDTLFNPICFKKLSKYSNKNYYTTFSKKYFKGWTFFFNNVDYYTDAGLLTEDKDLKNYLVFEKPYEILDLREQDNFFFAIGVSLSNIRYVYNRKYMKTRLSCSNRWSNKTS